MCRHLNVFIFSVLQKYCFGFGSYQSGIVLHGVDEVGRWVILVRRADADHQQNHQNFYQYRTAWVVPMRPPRQENADSGMQQSIKLILKSNVVAQRTNERCANRSLNWGLFGQLALGLPDALEVSSCT